ncbi:MAG: hypothetical protein PHR35_08075 [Kiritimatiellae bacterium]|nr:hypothetical protein [Kiritimatiellia bacterium]
MEITPPDGHDGPWRHYDLSVMPGLAFVSDRIEIPNPLLWWPNGMGEQPLYTVTARVTDPNGGVCDSRTYQIGLRTVEIDRRRLSEGSRFCVRINGEDVFCRGGNLGPHDAILARLSDAKYEALVAEARSAHLNMFRINGCSIFEGPAFYNACDRAGIMIWHDFMLTCTTYPDENAAFCEAVRAESEAAIRLLRHHPSIVLWCGNNECTWGFRDWWNAGKTQPLAVGGAKFYNRILPDLCRQIDPRRPYWTSSPSGGDHPNSELDGDCHWWHPAFMNADMQRRIRHEVFDECRARFASEYGVIGPCHPDSIREYLATEERTPGSLAWRMHTNTFEKDTLAAAIRRHYAEPEDLALEDYSLYGQLFQATMYGNAMEALRFRKLDPIDDCQGALIWSYSDCWGETGWSILDYYLRRKASYYWMRRACRPMKVIVRRRGDRLVTRVVNDTLRPLRATMESGWWRLDGSERDTRCLPVEAPANGMVEVNTAPLPADNSRDSRQWLYAAVLRDDGGVAVDHSLLTLLPYRELDTVANPAIEVKPAGRGVVEVISPVFCHAVHVEDHGHALLSDNWFDLLPGVPVKVRLVDASRHIPTTGPSWHAVASSACVSDITTQ